MSGLSQVWIPPCNQAAQARRLADQPQESSPHHARKGLALPATKEKWVCATDSKHELPVYPNLIKDLHITGINQLWVTDITYIHILVCFIYLAVILDVYSRKVIGYEYSMSFNAIDKDMFQKLATEFQAVLDRFKVGHGKPPSDEDRKRAQCANWFCLKDLYQEAN